MKEEKGTRFDIPTRRGTHKTTTLLLNDESNLHLKREHVSGVGFIYLFIILGVLGWERGCMSIASGKNSVALC